MATLCKNCAAPIVFDPKTQKVVCHMCGGSWDPQKIDVHEEYPVLSDPDQKPEDPTTVNYMACRVYTCQTCGGEIFIHGSEASTKCIYCGNSSVIFSRISKEKAPDFVLPFKLTRGEALESIRKTFKKRPFIPKEIRTIEPDMIRGIYVPYKIVNGRHFESAIIRSEVSHGESGEVIFSGRSGTMQLRNLPVDASYMLSNESSKQLEPFELLELQEFKESYLLGFYSNAADSPDETIQREAAMRASNAFNSQVIKTVKGDNARVTRCDFETYIAKDAVSYALLPVWFATFQYRGKHNTIMVNAQTGKVVGGIPWDDTIVDRVGTLIAILGTILIGIIMHALLCLLSHPKDFQEVVGFIVSMLMPTGIGFLLMYYAEKRLDKIKQKLHLTQASSIFNFAKKRQE